MSGHHPNYSIIKISQNTEKSPRDLRRLAVTQDSSGKPSANAGVKNSQMIKVMIFDHSMKWYIHKPESVQENA